MKTFLLLVALASVTLHLPAKSELNSESTSPVTFLKNKGQWQKEILYKSVSTSTNIYFLSNGLSFGYPGKFKKDNGKKEYGYLIWNLHFNNSNEYVKVEGVDGSESINSFFYGNDPSKWVIRPPEYKQIRYLNMYENIDIHFFGSGNDLKYDFIVKPNGDVSRISASYSGIKKLKINSDGELEVETLWDKQIQKAPVAWQIISGEKKYIDVQYKIINDSTFAFHVAGSYNRNFDLTIDPLFQMVWASYTKATGISNNINYCFGNAMDAEGNVYLTGMVDGTYPITPGAYSGPGAIVPEIFVSKFSSDGTTAIYSTYISGSSLEYGQGIAVDSLGRAHITGFAWTNFTGGNTYPTTPNAYQPNIVTSSGEDAIYTVLNPTGTGLEYSTFLGGSSGEQGIDIKIGTDGMAYLTGSTSSTDFPIKNSAITQTGQSSAFIAKFDISQSGANSLIYSAKIGATGNTHARSIDVDNNGNAYITGFYQNFGSSPIFPTTPGAINSTYSPGSDNGMVFVTKITGTLPVALSYSTLISSGDGTAISVDKVSGEAYVTGIIGTFTFPTTPGVIQPVHGQDGLGNGNTDAFVIKINSTGTSLIYSTFLGGEKYDYGYGIVVNSADEVYVTGKAQQLFPTSPGAFQENHANPNGWDFFIVHLNADATGYACGGSTYVGGNDSDYNSAMNPEIPSPIVTLRDYGGINDTIAVSGTSHSTNFPTTPGAYEPNKINGIADQPVFFKMTCFTTGIPPVANFNSTINQSCNVSTVNFTDISGAAPTSWQWSFPGATPSSSTQQNPQNITYNASGNYDVTLIACNQFGCDTNYLTDKCYCITKFFNQFRK